MGTTNRSFKKTVIKVVVISHADWEWGNLNDVAYSITEGDCSGVYDVEDVKFLSEQETAKELSEQGSDPAFLLGPDYHENHNIDDRHADTN